MIAPHALKHLAILGEEPAQPSPNQSHPKKRINIRNCEVSDGRSNGTGQERRRAIQSRSQHRCAINNNFWIGDQDLRRVFTLLSLREFYRLSRFNNRFSTSAGSPGTVTKDSGSGVGLALAPGRASRLIRSEDASPDF